MFVLKEIDKAEYTRLTECEEIYCINGCLFDLLTDNLIVFPVFDGQSLIPCTYCEVQNV